MSSVKGGSLTPYTVADELKTSLWTLCRHRANERERRADVVLVVLERLLDALAHGLEAGEVDHRVDRLLREEPLDLVLVEQVEGVHRQVRRSATRAGPRPLACCWRSCRR